MDFSLSFKWRLLLDHDDAASVWLLLFGIHLETLVILICIGCVVQTLVHREFVTTRRVYRSLSIERGLEIKRGTLELGTYQWNLLLFSFRSVFFRTAINVHYVIV